MDPTADLGEPASERRAARRAFVVMGRQVPRDAVLYLAGEVGARFLTFGSLIVLANLVAPEQFGFTSIYFGLSNLAAIVLGLGLPHAVVRFHFDVYPFRMVLGAICVLVGGAAVVGLALASLLATPLATFLRVPVPLVYAAVAGGIGIAIRTAWTASLRARRRSITYVVTLISEPITAIAIAVAWSRAAGAADYQIISWSFAIAALVVATGAVLMWARDPGLGWSTEVARTLLFFSMPLILHAFAMTALGSYDQVVINQTLGPAEAGRYAYAYRWGMAMVALTAAFGAVWGPRFMELVQDPIGRRRLDGMAIRGFTTIGISAAAFMIALPIIAIPFTPDEFRDALDIIPIVIYAYVWYALYAVVITYGIHAKRTRRLAAASAAVAAVITVANYVLIPVFGIVLAAMTSVGAYAALFALQWLLVRDVAIDIRYGRLAWGAVGLGALPVILFFIT
jgi:O-antigen/teichoic acid export membrane protein